MLALPVPQTSLRVLFVEDSAAEVEHIRLELARHGFQVQARVTRTRAEFLAAISDGPWDVVLSGYSTERFTPADALGLLLAHDADIPFIIVSRASGDDATIETVRPGAQDQAVMSNLRQLGPAVERELREAANRRMQRSTQDALQAWNIACGTRSARKP